MISSTIRFIRRTLAHAARTVGNFFVGLMRHFETTVVLVLATLGANMLLTEVPFYLSVPMWVEASMIIPVLAVFGVAALVKSAEVRASNRVPVLR